MRTINVKIKNKSFKVYVITYEGKAVNVAEPRLEQAILECIELNEFCDTCASIENVPCMISKVSDLYYYVFGDEDNSNPTEQDIIDSIADVWEGHV